MFSVYEVPEGFVVFSFYVVGYFMVDYVADEVFWQELEQRIDG